MTGAVHMVVDGDAYDGGAGGDDYDDDGTHTDGFDDDAAYRHSNHCRLRLGLLPDIRSCKAFRGRSSRQVLRCRAPLCTFEQ